MNVYNTLSGAVEPLEPPGRAFTLYVCGITPYDTTHLGHAFTYTVADVLVRYLEDQGLAVRYVQNVTDIDDNILRKAAEVGVGWRALGNRWTSHFIRDMQVLNVRPPDEYPRATDVIPDIVTAVGALIERGLAYVSGGSVYYHVDAWAAFGRLSHLPRTEMLEVANERGNRPDDPHKRDPLDFVLWQTQAPGEPTWDSPWGPGRPGWHIECSVMSTRLLGPTLDLHGGGGDLLFPHHECEIAQAEACTGKPFARYWAHNGMVNMGREKMSKSLGNTLNIREIVKRHSPDTLRLWMLGTHYRNMIEWSEERVDESKRAFERLSRLLHDAAAARDGGAGAPLPQAFAEFRPRFEKAMDDDFNTPQALGVLFDLGRALAESRDRGGAPAAFIAGVDELVQLSRVLGLFGRGAAMDGPPAEVQQMLTARGEARARRDFKRGDEIRDEIARLGWLVEDTPAGPRLTPKGP